MVGAWCSAQLAMEDSTICSGERLTVQGKWSASRQTLTVKCPIVLPDGKSLILVVRKPKTGFDLEVLSVEGEPTSSPLIQTPFKEDRPALSPDGRWIAYRSNESEQYEIYVRPFPSVENGKWQISRDGGHSPLWDPQRQELFYRNGDALMVVRYEAEPTFTRRIPEVLFTGTYYAYAGATRHYDIHPDGKRFLMIKEGGATGEARQEFILVQNWFEELKRLVPTE